MNQDQQDTIPAITPAIESKLEVYGLSMSHAELRTLSAILMQFQELVVHTTRQPGGLGGACNIVYRGVTFTGEMTEAVLTQLQTDPQLMGIAPGVYITRNPNLGLGRNVEFGPERYRNGRDDRFMDRGDGRGRGDGPSNTRTRY